MLDIQHYGSFIVAILIFQAVPGAGTIAILDATARNGKRAGMAAVMGTLAGDLLFMVAAVAGLAAIMQAHPLIFRALQWSGVAYLLWLGVQLLRKQAAMDGGAPARRVSARAAFRRAFLVSLTNPKVMLFFVAFFPFFLKPQASPATLLAMMLHVTVLSLLYQTALVSIGHRVARRCSALPGARTVTRRLAGLALIGLSIKLAADVR